MSKWELMKLEKNKRYNKMSEHGEKSQETLEKLLQQLSKGNLNSFDLENAKSYNIRIIVIDFSFRQ